MTRTAEPETIRMNDRPTDEDEPGVVAVRGVPIDAKQRIPYFVGVSEKTCGAKSVSMQLVILPPGGGCVPHIHLESETALYLISGRVETHYGSKLDQAVTIGPGEFLFIAPGVPHHARNLSDTEPAVAVAARNDANEQERVVLYDVGAGCEP